MELIPLYFKVAECMVTTLWVKPKQSTDIDHEYDNVLVLARHISISATSERSTDR
jgi:hypothetical protein